MSANDALDVASALVNDEIDLSRRSLLSALVTKFGGVLGVADAAKKLFDHSDDSPNVQAKLLDIVISGIVDLDQDDTPEIPEEDLIAVFRDLIARPELRPIITQLMSEEPSGG